MNILFISQLYPLSEDSSNSFALHYFVKEWSKDHHVQIIRPWLPMEKEKSPQNSEITIDTVTINVIKPIWIPLLKVCLINRAKVLNLLTEKPDIIICHLYNSYLTFDFMKKYFDVPFIVGIHGSDVFFVKNYFNKLRTKRVIKHSDVIAYRSLAIKRNFEKYIKIKDKNTFIAHSGIPEILIDNAKRLLNNTENKVKSTIRIISVCRLIKLKQLDKVIIALKDIKAEGIEWKYTIIGEGPEEQKLKDLTTNYNIEEQINFLGQMPRKEVFKNMGNHDVFVMPSYNETFGLVFLEAMANGCVVIGAKGWGIDGIVKNEENGFLCDPHNQEKIYVCLKKVLSMQNQKINEIRKNSLNTVLKFSDKKMANDYLKAVNFK